MAAPALALACAFVAYRAQPPAPDPVASTVAAYHQRTLPPGGLVADASGTPVTTEPAAGAKTGKNGKSGKSGKAATTAGPRQPATPRSAHRSGRSARAPASPSPAASHQASPRPVPSPSPSPSGSGSANLKSAVQKDIASGNYLLAVAQYLVENGYSRAAAAGVASCVDGESGGNPESVGSGGGGLIGWTPISSAAPDPDIITGNPARDMMTQLADILYYNSTEIGQSLVSQLNGVASPVPAADFYSQNFEKPAVTNSDVVPSVAQQVFSELGG